MKAHTGTTVIRLAGSTVAKSALAIAGTAR